MPTYTPYHGLTRPIPRDSVDRNIWGDFLNETVDILDIKLTEHGSLAQRPAPAITGRKYVTTDEDPPVMYLDTGAAWKPVGVDTAALDAHIADKTNPHDVTATQAGALSATGGSVTGDVTLGSNTADAALTSGVDPADAIVEATTPKGFGFTASETRDLLTSVDVTITNGTAASVTEDVTVNFRDGTAATSPLLVSETKSVTVAAGATSTTTFLAFRTSLDTGSYFVEVTQSGTALTVNQTTANTRGATYRIDQNATGDLVVRDYSGTEVLSLNAVDGDWRVNSISSPTVPAGGRFLDIEGGNNDIDLWHVGLSQNYGYSMRYIGSNSGNSNALELTTDNLAGDPNNTVFRVLQDASIDFTGALSSNGMGVARVNGYSTPRNIYQQTTAPTGARAGDMWFEL